MFGFVWYECVCANTNYSILYIYIYIYTLYMCIYIYSHLSDIVCIFSCKERLNLEHDRAKLFHLRSSGPFLNFANTPSCASPAGSSNNRISGRRCSWRTSLSWYDLIGDGFAKTWFLGSQKVSVYLVPMLSKLWACHCLIVRCKVRARQNGEQMRSFVAIVVTWFFISDILIAAQVLWESLTFRSIQVPLPKNKAILHQGLPSSLDNSTYVHRYTSSRASSCTHRYRYNIYIYIIYHRLYIYILYI